jgi:type I restriction enzyme S subunit
MIKRLSPVRRGASPRPIHDPKYFDTEGEFAWVRIADVSASERYLENTTQTLSDLGASLSVKRYPGDLFLSIAGTVGKPIISKIKCCIHDGFVYFPKLELNAEYLYYLFSTGLPYQGLGKWGTQLNLNTDTVGEIVIPIPSKSEMSDVVAFIDRKTADIDQLIARKEKLIALYEEEKTAIINHAVTKGLPSTGSGQVPPNVTTNMSCPSASIGHPVVESGFPITPSGMTNNSSAATGYKPSGIEWLGDIPVHWEVKRLKWLLSEKLMYGANESAEFEDINWPRYIRITDFGDDGKLRPETFKSLSYEVAKEYLLEDGDILFARSGATVGKTFQFKAR